MVLVGVDDANAEARSDSVRIAQAETVGSTPRWNGFSANHSEAKPLASAEPGKLDALCGSSPLVQPHRDPGSPTNGIAAMVTAARPRRLLASEKWTCTTRQSPASLRNTIVEREMNSVP